MLIFGYHLDEEDLTEKQAVLIGNSDYCCSCYSNGNYQPTTIVFGIELSDDNPLFYPIPVEELTKTQPTEEQIQEITAEWEKLPLEIRKKAKNQTPVLFIFTESDD